MAALNPNQTLRSSDLKPLRARRNELKVVIVGGSFVAGALLLILNRLFLNRSWPLLIYLRERTFISIIIVLMCLLASMALSFGALAGLTNWGQLYYPVSERAFILGIFTTLGISNIRGFSKLT